MSKMKTLALSAITALVMTLGLATTASAQQHQRCHNTFEVRMVVDPAVWAGIERSRTWLVHVAIGGDLSDIVLVEIQGSSNQAWMWGLCPGDRLGVNSRGRMVFGPPLTGQAVTHVPGR